MATSTVAAAAKTVTFKLPEKEPRTAVSLPKTPHPKKLQETAVTVHSPAAVSHGLDRPQSEPPRRLSPGPQDNELRPHSRPSSEQNDISLELKQKMKPAQNSRTRQCQGVKTHRRPKPTDTAQAINAVRERTNSATRDNIRLMKYNVAKLREHLLKVEEEIKKMMRGKNTLEFAVQDIRRSISVNQQSVSTQQKKTRAEMVNPFIRTHPTYTRM